MNKVILMGRLTADAEIRYSGEMAFARFTLAVDRRVAKTEEQKADFIGCVAFAKKAEFLERFGKKGTKFVVTGRIQTGSYENKEGKKVYTTDVVVEDIEFAESKGTGENQATSKPAPKPSRPANDGFMDVPQQTGDDFELPFM